MRLSKQLRKAYWDRILSKRDKVRLIYDRTLVLHSPTKNVSARKTFIHGAKDPRIFEWMDSHLKEGMVALDVGANVGVYSLYIAKRVGKGGRVFALEPTLSNLAFLRKSVDENGFGQVIIEAVAAGEREGSLTITHSKTNAGEHHVAAPGEEAEQQERVRVVSVDDLLSPHNLSHIDFIKIDVEGFEHMALLGMQKTLRSFSPILVVEHSSVALERYGISISDTRDLMVSLGYRAYELKKRGFEAYDWSHTHGDAFWSKTSLERSGTR